MCIAGDKDVKAYDLAIPQQVAWNLHDSDDVGEGLLLIVTSCTFKVKHLNSVTIPHSSL